MLREAVSKLKSSLELINDENNVTRNTLAVGLVVCIAVYWWMKKPKYNLPPGPIGLPVLGYLPLLLGEEVHTVFERLSREYGNVFGLYLARTYIVVLGDYETVKATLNQTAVLARPPTTFHFAPDGTGFGSASSTEWTEQRRFAVRSMRDVGMGGSKWETLIQEELEDIIKELQERNGEPADYSQMFAEATTNNIMTLVFGQRFPPGNPTVKLVNRIVDLVNEALELVTLRNFFPNVANLLAHFGFVSQSQDLHSKFVDFTELLKKQVDIRKTVCKQENSDILVDEYLEEIENNLKNNLNNTFTERNLRGTIMSLFAAGTDTTKVSLLWLLIAMVRFPDVQAKVHRELDEVLGKEGKAKYTERCRLPYTYAVMQESFRYVTIAPMSLAREAMEDITVNGYDIPKGTLILPSLYAIHKDPRYWKDPETFIPERFLTEEGQLTTSKMEGYVPFSLGKRNCPGETVAKITVFLYFAGIMQRFTVVPPVGKSLKLERKPGFLHSPVDQELRFLRRE